jgi:hypothetical protein
MSKPRSDSKLEPFREDLYPRMKAGTGQHALLRWLEKEHGVQSSRAALTGAWQRWSREDLEERVIKSSGLATDVLDLIDNPEQLDEALALAMKQSAFELVMQGGDPKTVKSFSTILPNSETLKHEQASRDLKLRQSEDQINAAKAELGKAKRDGGMTVEAIEAMEQQLGLL